MINSDVAKKVYTTTAGRLDYPIGFVYYKNIEDDTPQLKVTYQTIYDTPLVYGTDYTLSPDGLSIVLAVEPAVGTKLIIMRDVPFTQKSDYVIGRIDPDQIERDFDLAVMRSQQAEEFIKESIIDVGEIDQRLDVVESKIPSAASSINQLADKTYVTNLDSGLQTQITTNKGTMDGHIANKNNPHVVTKAQVGLGNCDNTSDLNKPISTATQTAITAHTSKTNNPHSVTKAQVGLGSCDNTSDLDKPISTATQTALDGKVNKNNAITAATKCKITYDSKGLVTGGADISTADLTNVSISSPTDGQFLRYDGASSKWKNTSSSASIGFSGITGQPRDNTALANEFDKYVTLATNQTITGVKTFVDKDARGFFIKSSAINKVQTPSSNQHSFIDFIDKYSTRLAVIGAIKFATSGKYGVYMQCGNAGSVQLMANDDDTNVQFLSPFTPAMTSNSREVSTTGFVKIYAMGIPDWTNKTSITSGTTVTKNGYVYGGGTRGDDMQHDIVVNGNRVSCVSTSHGGNSYGIVPVAVGDVVTLGWGTYYFVPSKYL